VGYSGAAQLRSTTAKVVDPVPVLEGPHAAARRGHEGQAAADVPSRTAAASATREAAARVSKEILRFRSSERALHWSIAVPFIVCLLTGIVLKLFFNYLHPQISAHVVLLWVHRISGACLFLLPALSALWHRKDLALYRYNIKRAWTWTLDDLKWLALIGPASLSRRIKLPEQHKFNAGEKLNFMTLMLTYPLLVGTGLFLLTPGIHFITWIAHIAVAVLSAPLIFGHVFMAVVNPDTRVGLSGMISGHVDREWAKHHYAKWYRETVGEDEKPEYRGQETVIAPQARAMLRCLSCGADNSLTSWATLLESVSELRPLECPECGAPSLVVSGVVKVEEVGAILEDLEHAGAGRPRRGDSPAERLSPRVAPTDEAGAALAPCPDRA
jgi:formate dehydrogenase gamma subunit